MRTRSRRALLTTAVVACLLAAGCGSGGGPQATASATNDRAITVASFDFPESELLAELYAQVLEARGFAVKRELRLGPRELVEPALERGLVELVPEYLGTSLQFVTDGAQTPTADVQAARRSLQAAFDTRGIAVLGSAPAQDANAVVVTPETAQRYGLRTISDLARVSSTLTFGGPPECPNRPLCLPGLERVYGLRFKRFLPLDVGGPVTVAALADGEIDVALLFTTDGNIRARNFVVLQDDRALQPAENVTPVALQEVLGRFGPGMPAAIDDVSASLTTEGLAGMNQLVSLGHAPSEVAAEWLRTYGFVR